MTDETLPLQLVREQLRNLYLSAVDEAYRFAKGERANDLRDKGVRKYNGQGLHLFSEAVGRALVLRDVLVFADGSWLLEQPELDPVALRREAQEQAVREFLEEFPLTDEMAQSSETGT